MLKDLLLIFGALACVASICALSFCRNVELSLRATNNRGGASLLCIAISLVFAISTIVIGIFQREYLLIAALWTVAFALWAIFCWITASRNTQRYNDYKLYETKFFFHVVGISYVDGKRCYLGNLASLDKKVFISEAILFDYEADKYNKDKFFFVYIVKLGNEHVVVQYDDSEYIYAGSRFYEEEGRCDGFIYVEDIPVDAKLFIGHKIDKPQPVRILCEAQSTPFVEVKMVSL